MGLLTEPRAAATVEAITRVEAHGVGRDRLLEMLDADSPAACKLVYEIGRTLAERMAATDETVAEVISRLEDARPGSGEVDVFRDQTRAGLELLGGRPEAARQPAAPERLRPSARRFAPSSTSPSGALSPASASPPLVSGRPSVGSSVPAHPRVERAAGSALPGMRLARQEAD